MLGLVITTPDLSHHCFGVTKDDVNNEECVVQDAGIRITSDIMYNMIQHLCSSPFIVIVIVI
jgi:hypothetical protein